MTQQPSLGQGGFNANQTLHQIYQAHLRMAQAICSIFTTPVEYALRPRFGTRYFEPITLSFTFALMWLLPLLTFVPGFGGKGSGVIGMGTLSMLFFIGHFIHLPRIWRRMLHMQLEAHSEYEGEPLPFLRQLPFGHNFWLVRIIHEPLFVALVAVTLRLCRLLDWTATIFLVVSALLLALKNFLAWYQSWLYLRILMDAKFAGPLIAKAAQGEVSEAELEPLHLGGFPASVPPEIRTAALVEMTPKVAVLPPDIARLVSPVDAVPKAA